MSSFITYLHYSRIQDFFTQYSSGNAGISAVPTFPTVKNLREKEKNNPKTSQENLTAGSFAPSRRCLRSQTYTCGLAEPAITLAR